MYKWYSNTHERMSSLAAESMPRIFQKLVSDFKLKGFFILGVISPDKLFCDFSNHYHNLTPTSKGYCYGKVHEKVKREMELVKKMLQKPGEVILHPRASSFFRGVIDTPLKAILFELGVISHYVADAHQPLHTDGTLRHPEINYNEIPFHREYEKDVRENLEELSECYLNSRFAGKKAVMVKDSEKFILGKIKKSNKYYDNILESYYPLNKTDEKKRFDQVLPLTKVCFNNSVYSIQCIWNSIDGLKDTLTLCAKKEKFL
jgi:hypothetical protein